MNTIFASDTMTARQLAAIAITIGAEHAWNADGSSSAVGAYGHAINAREAIVSGMGEIEQAEWFVLAGLLYDVRGIAQDVRRALTELRGAEEWAEEQRAEAVRHGENW